MVGSNMNIHEKSGFLQSGKLSAVENVKRFLQAIEKDDQKGKKINAFLQINKNILDEARKVDQKIKKGKAGRLAGLVISVKSNINTLGMKASCASKVLENYESTYDSTVIDRIRKEDGLIIGMTNMDEFACGSSGETSAFGPTKNPRALEYIPGGSSSGAAASVAAGFCDLALGSDTGGSIRNPASHCGVVGVKPSYGLVSRYGLVDLSMSLDQIGTIGNDIYGTALLLDVIKGKDERDAVSQDSKNIELKEVMNIPKQLTIGLFDMKISDKRIQNFIESRINSICDEYGWQTKKVNIDLIDLAVQTYYLLVYVEFFSGTRRFDGRRYGKRIEEFCGPEVLRRILGGSEIAQEEFQGKYYNLALKVKLFLQKEFSKAFEEVDCLIFPTVPRLPHKIGGNISVEDMYFYDALTIPPNLAGNCALSLPIGEIDGLHIGMQICCDKFQEQKMLQTASAFEQRG
jgi:aspartyl-tRNA(Asn)/glutamyl-tRNA(Gln) amidotransferase subunit A